MDKIRITAYVPEELWQRFRMGCLARKTSASQALTRLMTQELTRWDALLGAGGGSDFPRPLPGDLLNELPDMVATIDKHLDPNRPPKE